MWLGLTSREQRMCSKIQNNRTTRVLKAPGAELCQNAYGVVNEQKIFCSHQCSPECSMNKFRAYIYICTKTQEMYFCKSPFLPLPM